MLLLFVILDKSNEQLLATKFCIVSNQCSVETISYPNGLRDLNLSREC